MFRSKKNTRISTQQRVRAQQHHIR